MLPQRPTLNLCLDVALATLSQRRHRLFYIKYTPHWAHVSTRAAQQRAQGKTWQQGGIWTGS